MSDPRSLTRRPLLATPAAALDVTVQLTGDRQTAAGFAGTLSSGQRDAGGSGYVQQTC